MRELVIKAQNTGVLTEEDKTSISTELSTLRDEIDRISVSTTFNGKKLLNGDLATEVGTTNELTSLVNSVDVSNAREGATFTFSIDGTKVKAVDENGKECYGDKLLSNGSISGRVSFAEFGVSIDFKENTSAIDSKKLTTAADKNRADFKIGANTFTEDVLSVGIGDMSAAGLNKMGAAAGKFSIDISDATASDATLKAIDFAIDKVSSQRATIGTVQNRMEYAISNLSTTSENLSAAESRIRDVDMAEEMVNYTKSSILNQSAMAMLAQANQQPQIILSLLG
jgi:flagellin